MKSSKNSYKKFHKTHYVASKKGTALIVLSSSLMVCGVCATAGYFIYKNFSSSTPKDVNEISITLDANGGEFSDGTPYKEFNNLKKDIKFKDLKITNPVKEKSNFVKWTYLNQEVNSDFVLSKNMTIKANYENDKEIYHCVKFNSNGGSEVEDQLIKDGDKAICPHSVYQGYELEYWYLSSEKEKYDFNTQITNDITLTAKWKSTVSSTYTVYIDGNGGSFDKNDYITLNDVKKDSILKDIEGFPSKNPIKDNCTFLGYTIDSTIIDVSTYKVDKNLLIKAKWQENETFTVVLNANGGQFKNGGKTLFLNNVHKDCKLIEVEGYEKPTFESSNNVFAYWKKEDQIITDLENFKVTENISLYANYESCLGFTASEDNCTLGGKIVSTLTNEIDIQYSKDGVSWNPYLSGTSGKGETLTLSKGDTVFFKNTKNTLSESDSTKYFYFQQTGSMLCHGNVMSMINNSTLTPFCLDRLFSACKGITTAPELPAKELVANCYDSMFSYCYGLTKAPELPATKLADSCYKLMFSNCINLEVLPELVADEMADYCYIYMFRHCDKIVDLSNYKLKDKNLTKGCYQAMFWECGNLVKPPVLSATELNEYCYYCMFQKCSSLESAPSLPAEELKNYCYAYMFQDCTSLTSGPRLAAKTLQESCYYAMFLGCTSLLIAPEISATTLADSCCCYMFRDCSKLIQPPVLYSTTLYTASYGFMFSNCTSLKVSESSGTYFFKCPSDTSPKNCIYDMFANIASGEIIPSKGKSYYYG